jgi:hypothetical protein
MRPALGIAPIRESQITNFDQLFRTFSSVESPRFRVCQKFIIGRRDWSAALAWVPAPPDQGSGQVFDDLIGGPISILLRVFQKLA